LVAERSVLKRKAVKFFINSSELNILAWVTIKKVIKTFSPKIQGFLGKDKPPKVITVPKLNTKVLDDGLFLYYAFIFYISFKMLNVFIKNKCLEIL